MSGTPVDYDQRPSGRRALLSSDGESSGNVNMDPSSVTAHTSAIVQETLIHYSYMPITYTATHKP